MNIIVKIGKKNSANLRAHDEHLLLQKKTLRVCGEAAENNFINIVFYGEIIIMVNVCVSCVWM
jgi:hypothetical protein